MLGFLTVHFNLQLCSLKSDMYSVEQDDAAAVVRSNLDGSLAFGPPEPRPAVLEVSGDVIHTPVSE